MSDTDEHLEELEKDHEDEVSIAPTIYDASTFFSGPQLSREGDLPRDTLVFDFSYGYNARKYFNLAVPDPDHILFSSGNWIHIFDVPEKKTTFRRSALGGGIGNIRVNPNKEFNHVAVAENGNKFGKAPLVVIYEWPLMEIVTVLKGGSTASFTNLDYSPDGMLLVSQAGEPDYLITIYDWPKHTILLRSKSYVNDVYRIKFSESVPGQLCSAGVAHIKFWKMSNTFTGLKLKGEVGRFGKTEYTDIVGVLPMPDEKVVSGCSWGNLLIWEEGLIKVEVMRNNRKTLHQGSVVQIFYIEGELWTVSTDGHVKVWWYEKIDQADPPEDDRVVLLEPSYDFYTPGLMLLSIQKRYDDPESYEYFAQDGNGGLWIIDLNVNAPPAKEIQLYKCHSGEVMSIATAPSGEFFVTLGMGGGLFVYNYRLKLLIYEYKFPAKGSCMIWLPVQLSVSGDIIVLGFDDGNLRLITLHLNENPEKVKARVYQVIKPHEKAVTAISLNPTMRILVSGGADATIFVFKIDKQKDGVYLQPIGYVNSPETPSCITWKPGRDSTITVGCLHGAFFEVDLPLEPQPYTTTSYLLKAKIKVRKFMSYKSQIRRDIQMEEINARKNAKVERKRKEMNKIKEQNPGLEIDEDVFLADSESSIVFEPLYIPEVPCDILWLMYTSDNTIWISMNGYDAGYIYEYKIDQPEDPPMRYKMVDDADDTEISSYIYNYNSKYLIFAMQDGSIRINKVNPADIRDLSNYWICAVHENLNGFIPKMAFSYDEKYFFTCGHDGNVFSFTYFPEDEDYIPEKLMFKTKKRTVNLEKAIDTKGYEKLSLEGYMIKKENDRINKVANDNKKLYKERIAELTKRYSAILERNKALPDSQKIKREHLEVDPRVTEAIVSMMEKNVCLVRRKLAHELSKSDVFLRKLTNYYLKRIDYFPITVKAFQKDLQISCLRQKRLSPLIFNMQAHVDQRIVEAYSKIRPTERAAVSTKAKTAKKKKAKEMEYFLLNLSSFTLNKKMNVKFMRLLNTYRTRKAKWEEREDQWESFMALEPKKGVNHPSDVLALQYAEKTIGDYKLKTSKEYKVSDEERDTTLTKYRQLLNARRKQFIIRHEFSQKVFMLRTEKEKVRKELIKLNAQLKKLHEEIPARSRKNEVVLQSADETDYPENKFITAIAEDEFSGVGYMYVETETLQKIVPKPDHDQSEREVILGLEDIKFISNVYQDLAFLKKITEVCECNIEELMNLSTSGATPWEVEIRSYRLNRKMFIQEELIQKMNDLIESFDEKLNNLNNERAYALVDGIFVDLYMHTLHQELNILRDFEAHEGVLSDKVNARMQLVNNMQDIINDITNNIEHQNQMIEKNLEQQALIHEQFSKMVHDNKFSDFLRKVFKKKYKPPKVKHDDDSSSESSSSSSSESDEEDDAKSIDSRDFGFIKQDLNVCPKGCDPEVFDNTMALRGKRHELEIDVRESLREIEVMKKDLELNHKKLRAMKVNLDHSQNELEIFQRKKQEKINEVECTVVLSLDQMQHLNNEDELCNINDCLVFSRIKLSKLYKRVGELQQETFRLKGQHVVNVKHLTRMKTDLKFMQVQMSQLKQEIIELIQMKFGKTITTGYIDNCLEKKTFGDDLINELQEALLKKMVHDFRISAMDIKSLYKDEINLWEKKLANVEVELTEALRENTSKLDLLAVLKKEKEDLLIDIQNQDRKRETVNTAQKTSENAVNELKHLSMIIEEQKMQIREMTQEIKNLKSKSFYTPKIAIKDEKLKKEAEDEIHHAQAYLYPEDSVDSEMETQFGLVPPSTDQVTKREEKFHKIEMATGILNEILSNLGAELTVSSVENFITEILYPVIKYGSAQEIIKEIINNITITPSDQQIKNMNPLVENLRDTMTYEEKRLEMEEKFEEDRAPPINLSPAEIKNYVNVVLDDIIQDVLSQTEFKYHVSLCNIMLRAVEELPLEVLKDKSAQELLAKKLSMCQCGSKDSIDKVKLAEVIVHWDECTCGSKDSIDKVKLAEIDISWDDELSPFRRIVDHILNRVFEEGLDIISHIKNK